MRNTNKIKIILEKNIIYLKKIKYGIKNILFFGYSCPPEIIYFEKEKLIFIIIFKCWCTSIMKSLAYLVIGDKCYNLNKDNVHDRTTVPFKYINTRRLNKYVDEWCMIFAVIRDPLERLVSCYNDKIKDEIFVKNRLFWILKHVKTFDNFLVKILRIPTILHDNHFKPLHCWIPPKVRNHIKLLHIKNLEEDFEPIRIKYNLPKLDKMNASWGNKKKHMEEIKPSTLTKFQKRYMADYKLIEKYNLQKTQ